MPRSAFWKISAASVFFLALLALLLARCLARELNHDEGQFVAAGALLARHGLWPYRDYPYFHLPNLIGIYAALFSVCDHLLLAARSFNVLCAWATLLLLFGVAAAEFRALGERRWLVAGAIAFLLFLNPLFRFTAGRAWNHDLPILATLAASLIFGRALKRASPVLAGVAGLLLGLAVGTRLTFLPLALPFLAMAFLFPPRKFLLGAVFAAGLLIALSPTILLMSAAPGHFIFDNFTCNGAVNRLYRESTVAEHISWPHKLLFPFKQILPSPANLVLVAAFAYFIWWRMLRPDGRSALRSPELALLLSLLPFLFLGSWLPTPTYRQYFYAPVPFLFLGVIYGMARVWKDPARARKLFVGLSAMIVLEMLQTLPGLAQSENALRPSEWPPFALHRAGRLVRGIAGAGPILTVTPMVALEGGSAIYPELVTGIFGWRLAPFLPLPLREREHFFGAEDLERRFNSAPPPCILTGLEDRRLESPLVDFARRHQFRAVALRGAATLWVRP